MVSSKLTNGLLEGVNSLFQAAKRKARGYRSEKNIIAIVYVLAGKLNFALKEEKNWQQHGATHRSHLNQFPCPIFKEFLEIHKANLRS